MSDIVDAKDAVKGVRLFEMVCDVTGYPGPVFEEWPANLQDLIYKAMEDKSREVGLPLALVLSRADKDPDTGKFFVHVVLSEVVAVDTRMTQVH